MNKIVPGGRGAHEKQTLRPITSAAVRRELEDDLEDRDIALFR
jgi:hypothetical protein